MSCRPRMVFALAGCLIILSPALAQSTEDFYAGKTVQIVIGASAGGEYGLYSQLIAKHIGKFVPGNPTVIVQSMPGAGGMKALGFLANAAPQDGTVLSLPHVSIVQEGLLNPEAQFDPGKFQWIGRLREQLQVGVAWEKSDVRSLADAQSKQLIAGATALSNPTALNPLLLNALAGTKFKIVPGYPGTAEIALAWERGEVDVLTTSWDNITRSYSEQIKSGLVHPLFVYGMQRPPELADVPLVAEFGRTEDEKAFLKIYTIGPEIGRSLAAPPGVPQERVELWRAAFQQMLEDGDFKAAVSNGNLWINPMKGDELAAKVADVIALPDETVERARKFYDHLILDAQK